MLIDAVQPVGKFMKITAAKMHDKNFLIEISRSWVKAKVNNSAQPSLFPK